MTEVHYIGCFEKQQIPLVDGLSQKFKTYFRRADGPSKYLCFVPLYSTYALRADVKAFASTSGRHIFELIPETAIKDAALNRCTLVFDSSGEGDQLLEDGYENLHLWLRQNSIDPAQIIVVNQNRVLGDLYHRRFGEGIRFCQYDLFIKNSLRILQAAPKMDSPLFHTAEKAFLFMNGTPRPNRLLIAAALKHDGLLEDAEWSMLGDLSKKLSPSYEAARALRDSLDLEWISDAAISDILVQCPKILPWEHDRIAALENANELAYDFTNNFSRAFCSIVSETEFTDGSVVRITEKSLKPIAYGQPIVIFGNPFSLKLLKDIGFETYGSLIDESYDCISLPKDRLASTMRAARQLRSLRSDRAAVEAMVGIGTRNLKAARGLALEKYEDTFELALVRHFIDRINQ